MSEDNPKIKLYRYWNEIPFIKSIPTEDLDELLNSPIRVFILKKMRDGIEDEFGSNHDLERRHAFSIRELFEAYQSSCNNEQSITIQNFHFHMKKLKEMDIVYEVEKILEGRHYIRYFGRTAKVFDTMNIEEQKARQQRLIINPLKDLVKSLNPDHDPQEINNLLDDFLENLTTYFHRIYSWVEQNYSEFYDSGLDVLQFVILTSNFADYNKELKHTTNKIAKLLGLDQIEKYPPYDFDTNKEVNE